MVKCSLIFHAILIILIMVLGAVEKAEEHSYGYNSEYTAE